MIIDAHIALVTGARTGTGILLSPRIAATAAHVVGKVDTWARLTSLRDKTTRLARVVWKHEDLDLALLEVKEPVPFCGVIQFHFLTRQPQGMYVRGFPRGLDINDHVRLDLEWGMVDRITGVGRGRRLLKRPRMRAGEIEQLEGLCGGPLLTEHQALAGIVVEADPHGIGFIPIELLLQDEQARRLLPIDHQEGLFAVRSTEIPGHPSVKDLRVLLQSPSPDYAFGVGTAVRRSYEAALRDGYVLARDAKVDQIIDTLTSSHQILIYGGRRCGKTTLALQVMRRQASRRPVRYVALRADTEPEVFHQIFALRDESLLVIDNAEDNMELALNLLDLRGRDADERADIILILNSSETHLSLRSSQTARSAESDLFHMAERILAQPSPAEFEALAVQLGGEALAEKLAQLESVSPALVQIAAQIIGDERNLGRPLLSQLKQSYVTSFGLGDVPQQDLEVCAVLDELGIEIDRNTPTISKIDHLVRQGFLQPSRLHSGRVVGISSAVLSLWLPFTDEEAEEHIVCTMEAHPDRIAEICGRLAAAAKASWSIHVAKNAGRLLNDFLARPSLDIDEALRVLELVSAQSRPFAEALIRTPDLGRLMSMASISQARRLLAIISHHNGKDLFESSALRDVLERVLTDLIRRLPQDRLDDARGLLTTLGLLNADLADTVETQVIDVLGIERRIPSLAPGPEVIDLACLLAAFRMERRQIAQNFLDRIGDSLFVETWLQTHSPIDCRRLLQAAMQINRRTALDLMYQLLHYTRAEQLRQWVAKTCTLYQDVHHITSLVGTVRDLGSRVAYHFTEAMVEPVLGLIVEERRISSLGYAVRGFGRSNPGAAQRLFEAFWNNGHGPNLLDAENSPIRLGITLESLAIMHRDEVWNHLEERWTKGFLSAKLRNSGPVRNFTALLHGILTIASTSAETFILKRFLVGSGLRQIRDRVRADRDPVTLEMFSSIVANDNGYMTGAVRALVLEQIIPASLYREAMREEHTPKSMITGLRGMLDAHPREASAFVQEMSSGAAGKNWPRWTAPRGMLGIRQLTELITLLWRANPTVACNYVEAHRHDIESVFWRGDRQAQADFIIVLSHVDVERAAYLARKALGDLDLRKICLTSDLREITHLLTAIKNAHGSLYYAMMKRMLGGRDRSEVIAELQARVREESNLGEIAELLQLLERFDAVTPVVRTIDVRWIQEYALAENLPTESWHFLAVYDRIEKHKVNGWARRLIEDHDSAVWERLKRIHSIGALAWSLHWIWMISIRLARRAVSECFELSSVTRSLDFYPDLAACARAWLMVNTLFKGQPVEAKVEAFLDRLKRHVLSRCEQRDDYVGNVCRVMVGEPPRSGQMLLWQVGYLHYLSHFTGARKIELDPEQLHRHLIEGLADEVKDNMTLAFSLLACHQIAPHQLARALKQGDFRDRMKRRVEIEFRRPVHRMMEQICEGTYTPEPRDLDWFIARMHPVTRIVGF